MHKNGCNEKILIGRVGGAMETRRTKLSASGFMKKEGERGDCRRIFVDIRHLQNTEWNTLQLDQIIKTICLIKSIFGRKVMRNVQRKLKSSSAHNKTATLEMCISTPCRCPVCCVVQQHIVEQHKFSSDRIASPTGGMNKVVLYSIPIPNLVTL